MPAAEPGAAAVRYAALGDSYTIGEGAEGHEAWPVLLAAHLTRDGVPVELVANPSVTGRTTDDVLERQLPMYRAARPQLATLLIGVNDWVQEMPEERFRANFARIVEEMQRQLPSPGRLVVVTIPDFGVTPNGGKFSGGRDIAAGIARFNTIVREEAEKRGAPVVDVYPASQRMRDDAGLVAEDGLHPSAKAYAEWETLVYPVVRAALTAR